MNNQKISVIIPIHNAQQYLDQTIQSVQSQTYPHFELILIDDASTDQSKKICKKYAKDDHRILILENHTHIHGPGPARNIGLGQAIGDYVYFMDADDWIEPDLFEAVILKVQEHDPDILQFGFFNEREGQQEEYIPYLLNGKNLITKEDIKESFLEYWDKNRSSLWIHIYRRTLINETRFQPMMMGEDICFALHMLRKANKILYIPKAFYHYRVIHGSTSHQWLKDTVKYQVEIWKASKSFLDSFYPKFKQDIYAKVAYDRYIWTLYYLCMKNCPLTLKQKRKQLSFAREKMGLDQYRQSSCKNYYHGIDRIKYEMARHHFEGIILSVGALFLRIVRGE